MKQSKATVRQIEANLKRGWVLSGQAEDSPIFPMVLDVYLAHQAELELLAASFVMEFRAIVGEQAIKEIRALRKLTNKKPLRKPPTLKVVR